MMSRVLHRYSLGLCALLLAGAWGGAAHAITFQSTAYFTIKSDTNPTITFSLPTSPTPDFFDDGADFGVTGVAIKVNGAASGTDDFIFYNSSVGISLTDSRYFPNFGIETAQLYGGPESAPFFIDGVYHGTYIVEVDPNATITISGTAATPLPAALPLFASGIGAGFLALRRRKAKRA